MNYKKAHNAVLMGTDIRDKFFRYFKKSLTRLEEKSCPGLAIFGDMKNPIIKRFVKVKSNFAKTLGISTLLEDISGKSPEEVKQRLTTCNLDPNINGIIIQLPLPGRLMVHKNSLLNSVSSRKDVDGLGAYNFGRLFQGDPYYVPALPLAILAMSWYYRLDLNAKDILIIGDGTLVGRPTYAVIKLFFRPNSVTIIDRATANLIDLTKKADVIISGTGAPSLINKDMIKQGVILFDAGTYIDKENKLQSDINPDVLEKTPYYTPTPGGLGPLTVAMLFWNLIVGPKSLDKLKSFIDGKRI